MWAPTRPAAALLVLSVGRRCRSPVYRRLSKFRRCSGARGRRLQILLEPPDGLVIPYPTIATACPRAEPPRGEIVHALSNYGGLTRCGGSSSTGSSGASARLRPTEGPLPVGSARVARLLGSRCPLQDVPVGVRRGPGDLARHGVHVLLRDDDGNGRLCSEPSPRISGRGGRAGAPHGGALRPTWRPTWVCPPGAPRACSPGRGVAACLRGRRKRSPRKSRDETGSDNAALSAPPERLVSHPIPAKRRKLGRKPALVSSLGSSSRSCGRTLHQGWGPTGMASVFGLPGKP